MGADSGRGVFGYRSLVLIAASILVLASLSFSETTCSHNGCEITLTIKIAFAGADNAYMARAENEIESVWNGQNGFRIVGDCKCRIKVDVITIQTADCVNNPPAGYHCVTVTPFFTPGGAAYDNPPRNQTNITGASLYIGYMFGIATGNGGNSQQGWWSDQMSRQIPGAQAGTHYNDFAHEAGHMMGLGHSADGGSIMNNTNPASGPTRADLDGAAKAICGDNYCPDSCCCGNGIVDKNKGEGCDPLASPPGCGAGESCCPVCCSCYMFPCQAANGEYPTLSACQSSCGIGASCYMNFKTSCYDCLKQTVVVTGTCSDPANIRGNLACDHPYWSFPDAAKGFFSQRLLGTPFIGGVFSDERVNIITAEGDKAFMITKGGAVAEFGETSLSDPTMTVTTNRETILSIMGGEYTVREALVQGKITVEGNNFMSGIRFGISNVFLGIYNFFNSPEQETHPAAEHGFPIEYYETMMEWNSDAGSLPAKSGGPENIGRLPDLPFAEGEITPS